MEDIVEIRAIVRIALLDRVVRCLKESGVPRLTVTRVHAIGAGVDPASTSLSFEEGSVYSDKAQVQFICDAERSKMYTDLIVNAAGTGRQGDGIVSLHPVRAITKIRTGAEGLAALS